MIFYLYATFNSRIDCMENKELIKQIANEYSLAAGEDISSLNIQKLAEAKNELLNNDFKKLVSILYRMDVSEPKLKNLLANHPQADAGIIIAQLMIERQLQKIATRKQFRQQDDSINEEDKW